MVAYYILLGLPILISLLKARDNNALFDKKIPLFVFFFLFISMLCLRGLDCGIDLQNYSIFYRENSFSIKSIISFEPYEPGYNFLEFLFSKVIHSNFRLFLCVCALLSVVPIYFLYIKRTNHPLLTISLFVVVAPFSMFFSGLRQSIAIGFGAFAFILAQKKKPVKFILICLLALIFHRSAFVLFSIYPLYNFKIKNKHLFVIIPLIFLLFIFNKEVFSFLVKLFGEYGEKYSNLSETNSYGTLFLLIIFVIFCFTIPDKDKLNGSLNGARNLLLWMVVIQCFAPIHALAMRFNYYFLIFVPIIIPQIIDSCSFEMRNIAKYSLYTMTAFFFAYFFVRAYTTSDILNIFPYSLLWD